MLPDKRANKLNIQKLISPFYITETFQTNSSVSQAITPFDFFDYSKLLQLVYYRVTDINDTYMYAYSSPDQVMQTTKELMARPFLTE